MSDLEAEAVIDIPCYFGQKSNLSKPSLILAKITWDILQLVNLTLRMLHDNGFQQAGHLSSQKLHQKSH